MKTVNVIVWSDFVCPWCWIAQHRLEKAIQRLAGQVQVVVTHKAYRIARGMSPMDFKAALQMKFASENGARQMMAAVSDNGALEGLVYNFDTMRFGDTADAHSLVKSVASEALRHTLIEALSNASITDGKDIFNREVLRAIAVQAGVSELEMASINFDRTREIEQDERQASRIANGVPLFVFNDQQHHLSGAQPVEVFVAALKQAAESSPESIASADSASCGIAGCH